VALVAAAQVVQFPHFTMELLLQALAVLAQTP
jgi:hypothetical protein